MAGYHSSGGYIPHKLKLRDPNTGKMVCAGLFRHQIAALAAGYGPCMLRVYQTRPRKQSKRLDPEGASHEEIDTGGVQVSHRCHTADCFNPRHVIVEYPVDNRNRRTCGPVARIHCNWGNGKSTKAKPCEHASRLRSRLSCLVPEVDFALSDERLAFYYSDDVSPGVCKRLRPTPRAEGPGFEGFERPNREPPLTDAESEDIRCWLEQVLMRGTELSEHYGRCLSCVPALDEP